jgi:peroxiredoxin
VELEEAYQAIRAEGAELIAISVDDVENARLMAEHANASFPILSDSTHEVTELYGVFNLLEDGVSAPATYVVTKDGDIPLGHVGQDIGDRVSAVAIINGLRQLQGKDPLPTEPVI